MEEGLGYTRKEIGTLKIDTFCPAGIQGCPHEHPVCLKCCTLDFLPTREEEE